MSRWSKTARASCWDSNHRTILTTRKLGQSGVDRAVLGRRFYAPDRGHHQGALRHPEGQVWLAELPLIFAILVAIRRATDRFRCSQEALRKCRWWFCRCTVVTQHRSLLPSCFQSRAIYVQKDHKTTTEQIQIIIVDLMDMEMAKAAQRLVWKHVWGQGTIFTLK